MGFVAPLKNEKHRVVIEVRGPMTKNKFAAYKRDLLRCLRQHRRARVAIKEIVKRRRG